MEKNQRCYTEEEISLDFRNLCSLGKFEDVKLLHDMYPNYVFTEYNINEAIYAGILNYDDCSEDENMELMFYILDKQPSLKSVLHYNSHFMNACGHGAKKIAQFIYNSFPALDVCMNDNYAFKTACRYNHLETAKWLVELRPDIYSENNLDDIFKYICGIGYLHIAEWLQSLKEDRFEIISAVKLIDIKHIIEFNIYENNDRVLPYLLK